MLSGAAKREGNRRPLVADYRVLSLLGSPCSSGNAFRGSKCIMF